MNAYLHASCWALAIMGVAVLNILGVVSDGAAQAAFTTLPILAVISITQRGRCARRKAC